MSVIAGCETIWTTCMIYWIPEGVLKVWIATPRLAGYAC